MSQTKRSLTLFIDSKRPGPDLFHHGKTQVSSQSLNSACLHWDLLKCSPFLITTTAGFQPRRISHLPQQTHQLEQLPI